MRSWAATILILALALGSLRIAAGFTYAVVLDCGSSGTRLHVYQRHRNGSGGLLDLLPSSRKIVPGLASFSSRPELAVDNILPLLAFAGEIIPREAHGAYEPSAAGHLHPPGTEVFVLCTGGMRQLGQREEDGLLGALVDGLNARRTVGSAHGGQPFTLKRHQAVRCGVASKLASVLLK